MSRRASWLLELHRQVAQVCAWGLFAGIAWLRFGRRYRIADLRGIRRRYRELALGTRGPLLICATHPTRADALLVLWALASPVTYVLHQSRYPWVVTDPGLFPSLRMQRWLGLLWKSVYVSQGAGLGVNRATVDKLDRVLAKGEAVLVFPEGTRGDRHPSYLVGRMLQKYPDARVLCVSLRPDRAAEGWERPRRGTRFSLALSEKRPRTAWGGVRGAWDLASQVQRELEALSC